MRSLPSHGERSAAAGSDSPVTPHSNQTDQIVLEVRNRNVTDQKMIGTTTVPVSNFADGQLHDDWLRLYKKSGAAEAGQIHIRAQLFGPGGAPLAAPAGMMRGCDERSLN